MTRSVRPAPGGLPEPNRPRRSRVDYDAVVADLAALGGEWAIVVEDEPYESAVSVVRTLRRRGAEAHVRGTSRKTNGPATVWARMVPAAAG